MFGRGGLKNDTLQSRTSLMSMRIASAVGTGFSHLGRREGALNVPCFITAARRDEMSAPSEQMVPALPRPLTCTPCLREAAQTDGERVVSRHAKHHHRPSDGPHER